MLLEQIKTDMKTAMRTRNKIALNVLRTLKGELERNSKESNDSQVLSQINKMIKGIKETYKKVEMPDEQKQEISILENYKPTVLTEDIIAEKINEIVDDLQATSMKDMRNVMSEFNTKYPGQNGKLVSSIVKDILS